MTATSHDRSLEDQGNIIALEHLNVQIDDQRLATLFYIGALGLTRDPYMMTSTDNMWVNVGRSQFHLPTGGPAQRLRGRVGLVIDDRESLVRRLGNMRKALSGTRFDFVEPALEVGQSAEVNKTNPKGLPDPSPNSTVAPSTPWRASTRRVLRRRPASRSAWGKSWSSARPKLKCRPMTAITSKSMSRTSQARTAHCSSVG